MNRPRFFNMHLGFAVELCTVFIIKKNTQGKNVNKVGVIQQNY